MKVIELSNRVDTYHNLIRFLKMARMTLQKPKIDTTLAYAYAKTGRLQDLEDFLSSTNVADVREVGEMCFGEQLYRAAKLLFSSISDWMRLSITLTFLGENQAAVESARKAGNTR
jgi:clathrin heavy chain